MEYVTWRKGIECGLISINQLFSKGRSTSTNISNQEFPFQAPGPSTRETVQTSKIFPYHCPEMKEALVAFSITTVNIQETYFLTVW